MSVRVFVTASGMTLGQIVSPDVAKAGNKKTRIQEKKKRMKKKKQGGSLIIYVLNDRLPS